MRGQVGPTAAELHWPGWASLLELGLLLSTQEREQRAAREEARSRIRAAQEAGQPADRRDVEAAQEVGSSSVYVPPPLRLPVPHFSVIELCGSARALSAHHLQLLAALAPTLRKLEMTEEQPPRSSGAAESPQHVQASYSLQALAPLARGREHELQESDDAESEHDGKILKRAAPSAPAAAASNAGASSLDHSSPDPPHSVGGVVDVSLHLSSWPCARLASLQACGAWPSLRRLTLSLHLQGGAAVAAGEEDRIAASHPLSMASSDFHPALFWKQLGLYGPLPRETADAEQASNEKTSDSSSGSASTDAHDQQGRLGLVSLKLERMCLLSLSVLCLLYTSPSPRD